MLGGKDRSVWGGCGEMPFELWKWRRERKNWVWVESSYSYMGAERWGAWVYWLMWLSESQSKMAIFQECKVDFEMYPRVKNEGRAIHPSVRGDWIHICAGSRLEPAWLGYVDLERWGRTKTLRFEFGQCKKCKSQDFHRKWGVLGSQRAVHPVVLEVRSGARFF